MVDEKKEVKTEEQKPNASNTDEGVQSETNSLVDRANLAAERIEKANAEMAEHIRKQEDLLARQRLGGQSEAGTPSKEPEISNADYAKMVMEGRLNANK